MNTVTPRFSWSRVLITSACVAIAVALAVLVPLLWHYQQTMSEQVLSIPRPRPADAATQAAIVRGLLQGHRYEGVPPPPPEPGDPPRSEAPWRFPLLIDRTAVIAFEPPSSLGPDVLSRFPAPGTLTAIGYIRTMSSCGKFRSGFVRNSYSRTRLQACSPIPRLTDCG
jgi:hypothetical protein